MDGDNMTFSAEDLLFEVLEQIRRAMAETRSIIAAGEDYENRSSVINGEAFPEKFDTRRLEANCQRLTLLSRQLRRQVVLLEMEAYIREAEKEAKICSL